MSAEPETLITDEMRGLIGKVMRTATSMPVTASDIRKFAIAVYFPAIPPRLYWDEEYAATTKWGGIVAPEEFNPITASWLPADPPPDRYVQEESEATRRFGDFERVLGVEPPPYRAVLQSRVTATYSGLRIRVGDVIRSESSITEYFERVGRMGLQLYTTISDNLYDQEGRWIKRLDTVFLRYR